MENQNIITVNKELSELSNLHNLHFIEMKNIFNNSLLLTYNKEVTTNVACLNFRNQVVFYDINTQDEVFYNISMKKFKEFLKVFNKQIAKRSSLNEIHSLHDKLSSNRFIELQLVSKSRKYITLRPIKDDFFHNKMLFKHKIKSKLEDDFIQRNDDSFWLYLNDTILKNVLNFTHDNKQSEIQCDITDQKVSSLIINSFIDKINTKLNDGASITIKYFDKENSVVHLKCNIFIPIVFVNYIASYIEENTIFRTKFMKNSTLKATV